MPYRLILHMKNGDIIESPNIAPNNPRSQFGYEEKKIVSEINKTGRSMVKQSENITSFKCKHLTTKG